MKLCLKHKFANPFWQQQKKKEKTNKYIIKQIYKKM